MPLLEPPAARRLGNVLVLTQNAMCRRCSGRPSGRIADADVIARAVGSPVGITSVPCSRLLSGAAFGLPVDPPHGCDGHRGGGQLQVLEDPPHDRRVGQEGEDDQGAVGRAPGTLQCIDVQDPAQQLGPAQVNAPGVLGWWAGGRGSRRMGRSIRCGGGGRAGRSGIRVHAGRRCHLRLAGPDRWGGQSVAEAGPVGEDAVVSDQVLVGRGQQGGQAPQEGDGLQDDLGPALGRGPGTVQAVADASVGVQGQAVQGEGGAQPVSAQALQAQPVGGGDGASGVKRESLDPGAQGLGGGLPGPLVVGWRGGLPRKGSERPWTRRPDGLGDGDAQRQVVGVLPGRVVLGLAESLPGQVADASRQPQAQGRDVGIGGRRQGHEGQRPARGVGVLQEHPVGHQRVEVGIEVEDAAEALHEGHGADLAVVQSQPPGTQPHPGRHGPQKGPQHQALEGPVGGQQVAHLPGERQHPLAVACLGQHPIHQVRSRVRRPARPAGWAQSPLARERHQPLEPAVRASQAGETVGQHAAIQVAVELVSHERWVARARIAAPAGVVQQIRQVAAHDRVQGGPFGLTAPPARRQRPRRLARGPLEHQRRQRAGRRTGVLGASDVRAGDRCRTCFHVRAYRGTSTDVSRSVSFVIDGMGYLSYDNAAADILFQIVNRRYETKPIILTTNMPFREWSSVFPNAAFASAQVDRLTHHSHGSRAVER